MWPSILMYGSLYIEHCKMLPTEMVVDLSNKHHSEKYIW